MEKREARRREKRETCPIMPTPPPSLWKERKKEQKDARAAAAVGVRRLMPFLRSARGLGRMWRGCSPGLLL